MKRISYPELVLDVSRDNQRKKSVNYQAFQEFIRVYTRTKEKEKYNTFRK